MPAVPVTRLPFTLTESSVLAVIPARYHSTRLPGKVLLDLGGRPLIEHVHRRAAAAASIDAVIVATDDERVADAVSAFGGVAVLTSASHVSGTDRIAEVAGALPCRIVVGVQGDEPLLDADVIDAAVKPLLDDPDVEMGTVARRATSATEIASPHVVKVVCDERGFALYFSRAPIPHGRDGDATAVSRVHVGLYAYRRTTLLRLASLRPGPLERAEMLEQLRALENGIRIHVAETDRESCGVDTAEDLERVRQRLLAGIQP